MAYVKKIWKDYPDTTTPINAENLNNIENGIEAVDTALNSGWIPANEIWTYSSVDDPVGLLTISGNVTTKYSLGMRIKFTNGGNVIYGIITAISYSSPNTTLTFLHEIDPADSLALYLIANSAITENYYSSAKAPYGFPLSASKWTVETKITSNYIVESPSTSVYYGPDVLSLIVPAGLWEMSYQVGVQMKATSTQYCTANISTSPTALENNAGLTDNQALPVAGVISKRFRASNKVELTEKKTYYFMFKNDTPYTSLYIIGSSTAFSSMQALCAYL